MSAHQRTRAKHVNALLEPREVRDVLSRLCIRFGLCLPEDEIEKIAASPPTEVESFTEAVLVAEGYGSFTKCDPLCAEVREVVAQAFIHHLSKNPD
jgi:hypothetical protein